MSNPSYSNIDRWLFELMEGNLSPEQITQLESFLIQHPELDVDRDMWELAKVDNPKLVYHDQQKLVKRRPVGLYMSLGFASIGILVSLGLYNYSNEFSSENLSEQSLAMNANSQNKSNNYSESFKKSAKIGLKEFTSISSPESQLNSSQFKSNSGGLDQNIQLADEFYQKEEYSDIKDEFHSYTPESDFLKNENVSNEKTNEIELKTQENKIELATQEARPIEFSHSELKFNNYSKSSMTSQRFAKSDYKMSFNSRMNKMGRSIQRMMDNPVALKNMKDPYYHVPGMQAMDINFGAVGTLLATRIQTVSRAQWYGQENQHLTNQISIDGYSYGMRGGLGFQMNHNYYGKGGIENFNASLTYSPKFSVARNVVIEPSVRFKMGNKVLHSSKIQEGAIVEFDRNNIQEYYANGTSPIGQNLWYKDLGLGLMVNTKWFFIGIQGDNLMEHFDNIYTNDLSNPRRIGKHFVGTIGTDYESKKENITISPYVVFQNQEKLSEGWAGVNFRYHWLTVGGALSSNLEPAASLGLKFDHFMISYNADYVQSQMLQGSHLSHQVTVRFLTKPSRIGERLLNQ